MRMLLGLIAMIVLVVMGTPGTSRSDGKDPNGSVLSGADEEAPSPVSELSGVRPPTPRTRVFGEVEADPWGVGTVEPVSFEANADVASIAEAYEKKLPERLTASLLPKPFDREKFSQDPEKYLHTVEPGRVFRTAQPSENVPAIEILGRRHRSVRQGQSVDLKVRAAANSPVTFTSFDMGAFSNKLPSITVLSNSEGMATVEFYGTSGTIGDCHILAGCPEAWGQARFLVIVNPAQQ